MAIYGFMAINLWLHSRLVTFGYCNSNCLEMHTGSNWYNLGTGQV